MKRVNEMTAKEFQAEMLVWAEAYGFSFIEYRDGVFSVECEDGRVIEANPNPRCLKLYGSPNSTVDIAARWQSGRSFVIRRLDKPKLEC